MKIRIVFGNFLTSDGKEYVIGGIETYIKSLCCLAMKNQMGATIYQFADKDFHVNKDGLEVKGRRCAGNKVLKLVKFVEDDGDIENDLLIFATDYDIVSTAYKKVIGIQHGVSWDIAVYGINNKTRNFFYILKDTIRILVKLRRYSLCKNLVCVDYNFINWYRTKVKYISNSFYVVPNFTQIPEFTRRNENPKLIKIIFARRLVEYRGTKLFASALEQILTQRKDVAVTIAGSGPDKAWLEERMRGHRNISFIDYNSDESIKVHKQHDIAVVPTIGSEGTSLSLLEAMASGCAVIATNVGGMTNIILDGFNGLMIAPDIDELYGAMIKLITDIDLRRRLAENAYITVKESFSYEKWEENWLKVIRKVTNEKK